ncbi:hypothetical protein [Streptomyces recifensis]|uniref:hypothetical protein n=1 Tax=Streptomyces recifensis TaxID=67355 RepID=UPI0011201417|nr:hypothetical protein [Streptomyces recifensis]
MRPQEGFAPGGSGLTVLGSAVLQPAAGAVAAGRPATVGSGADALRARQRAVARRAVNGSGGTRPGSAPV